MSSDPQTVIPTRSLRCEETRRQLERDGLLRSEGAGFRTTRRWQAAMARAALRLLHWEAGRPADETSAQDLRVPVVAALLELYGADVSPERVVELCDAIMPIEAAEIDPGGHARSRSNSVARSGSGSGSGA